MSDGFADIVGKFDVFPSYDLVLQEISETSLETVADKLFQVQEGDRDMTTFPRLKFSDDTTAVLVLI